MKNLENQQAVGLPVKCQAVETSMSMARHFYAPLILPPGCHNPRLVASAADSSTIDDLVVVVVGLSAPASGKDPPLAAATAPVRAISVRHC